MTVTAPTPATRLDAIVDRYRAQLAESLEDTLDAMELDESITPREFADLLRLRFADGLPTLSAGWLPA